MFNPGDIVALNSHPFHNKISEIIISGDATLMSPLLIVSEIYKVKQAILGCQGRQECFKYKCIWFSTRLQKFRDCMVLEDDLKLILACTINILPQSLIRGQRVRLRNTAHELAKKKSSLSYKESSSDANSTTITALLAYISPVMQVIEIKPNSGKTSALFRSAWVVKCLFFDTVAEKFSEIYLPVECLEPLENVDEIVTTLYCFIANRRYLYIFRSGHQTIGKPETIAFRSGKYYLRFFDLLTTKIEEVLVSGSLKFEEIKEPFEANAPKFNIEEKPEASSKDYITKEILQLIENASKNGNILRIKYKNKNDEFSVRSIRKYRLVTVGEDGTDVTYLIGYCILRNAERNFRVDRIQNAEELKLKDS